MEPQKLTNKSELEIYLSILDDFGGMLFQDNYAERCVANTVKNEFEVDTTYEQDTGYFELAFSSPHYNDNYWIVVSEYATREEALIAHNEFVSLLDENGLPEAIKDIHCDEVFVYEP
mgnify:CR=1 FL=1